MDGPARLPVASRASTRRTFSNAFGSSGVDRFARMHSNGVAPQ